MSLRLTPLVLLAATGLLFGHQASAADTEDRDKIYRKNGAIIQAYVESENTTDVLYRTIHLPPGSLQIAPSKLKVSELDHIVYNGMDSGHWIKGVEDKDNSNYDSAAEHFHQVAETGTREWEKVYGSIAEGECLELSGRYAEAAKAYGVIVNSFAGNTDAKPPVLPNRFWLDCKYHLGMCLAQAKSPDAAKTADELDALGKKDNVLGAETRANAIRTAIAGADGNVSAFIGFMKKVNFRSYDEREVWFSFKLYCAEMLRVSFKKPKEAASAYSEIASGLGNDPARQAQVSLGIGLCLVDTDHQGALLELLKLDALPYGSADQKCEARFNAGHLLWDEASALKSNAEAMKDQRKVDFVRDTERSARLLVTAATEGPAKNPNVALAKSLLASFGPDPDAPKTVAPKPGAATTGQK